MQYLLKAVNYIYYINFLLLALWTCALLQSLCSELSIMVSFLMSFSVVFVTVVCEYFSGANELSVI